jgi:cytochrome b561
MFHSAWAAIVVVTPHGVERSGNVWASGSGGLRIAATRPLYASDSGRARYAPAIRWLHWITALLVLGMFVVGGWLTYFDSGAGPFKETLYMLHESTGMTIGVLVLIRIVVWLTTGAPTLPDGTPGAVRVIATLNHIALYLVLLIQPIIGLMDANAWGAPLRWFGLFLVPSPIGKQSDPVAQSYSDLHWWVAATLPFLLVMHILGVGYHALVKRDGVIQHMA